MPALITPSGLPLPLLRSIGNHSEARAAAACTANLMVVVVLPNPCPGAQGLPHPPSWQVFPFLDPPPPPTHTPK